MDEEIPGPSTRNNRSTYSDNRKVSTGIQAKELVIHGNTIIDQRQVTQHYSHIHRNNDEPANGLVGSYNFALDDIPNILASRRAELELMHQKLEASTVGTGAKVVILAGMGGVGKTTLAKLYARNKKDDFDNLIWVDAETEESLEATFMNLFELVHGMKCENNTISNSANISRLHNNILKHKTLWMFDNVEDFELYKRFSPKSVPPKCHPPVIIITTRIKKGWTDLMESAVSIEKLNLRTCEKYIRLKLSGTAVPTTDIDQHWAELAEYTGGLVIALNSALTAIVERNRMLEAGGGEPLKIAAFLGQARVKFVQEVDVSSDEPHVRSIYTRLRHLWTDTLEMLPLRPHGPLALRFLNLMSYMSSTGVPTFWFKILAKDLVTDEFEVVQALDLLVSWSLADKIGEKHCVHRVLQDTLLRRSNRQKIDDFLTWTVPALKILYLELRIQGRLTGYFPGIECFLRHFDPSLYCTNDTFLLFFVESLEIGIQSLMAPLRTLVTQLAKEEIRINFDVAKSLLKNVDISDTSSVVVIKQWFKQFEAENAVKKIQLVALINWMSIGSNAAEIMQLVVEASLYFKDAIGNSETSAEITETLMTLIKMTRFVSEKFKKPSTDFNLLWSQFNLTTLNLIKATEQLLQKFNTLEVVPPSSNNGLQPILVAAAAILHQLDLFEIAESESPNNGSPRKPLQEFSPEFRDSIRRFTDSIYALDSIDKKQVLDFCTIFEIQQGPKILHSGVDHLALTLKAAVAAKVYRMLQNSVKKSSKVLQQIISFILAEFRMFSAFKFTILYTFLNDNLETILQTEFPLLQVDYFTDLMNSGHFISNWVSGSKIKWQSKGNTEIKKKLQTLDGRALDIFQCLRQLDYSSQKSSSAGGFRIEFAETVRKFGCNSFVTFQKVFTFAASLQPWEKHYASYIPLLEEALKLSLEEHRLATTTGNCECYPEKYQTLLAKLYFDKNDLSNAIQLMESAFVHQLLCLRENITKSPCTSLYVELLYSTENPSLEVHNLLNNILQGQLEFFGQNHISSWISYLDLATFYCLEGDVNKAIDSVCKICCSTPPGIKDLTFKLMRFFETLAGICALIVEMLLWRKRAQSATEFINNFQTWFVQLGTWTKKYHPTFDNGYNQLLHILDAIALYQLGRYSESFSVQRMFNCRKLELHYWKRKWQVRENWRKFAKGTSFLSDAGIWCKRIQECFAEGLDKPQVLQKKLRDLKTNRKNWYKTTFKNEITIHFNLTVEKLLFYEGQGLSEKDWNKMIKCHKDMLWDLNFKYTDSHFFFSKSHLREYSRESVISGEVFVACLINDYKRGTFQRECEEMPVTGKSKCKVV